MKSNKPVGTAAVIFGKNGTGFIGKLSQAEFEMIVPSPECEKEIKLTIQSAFVNKRYFKDFQMSASPSMTIEVIDDNNKSIYKKDVLYMNSIEKPDKTIDLEIGVPGE